MLAINAYALCNIVLFANWYCTALKLLNFFMKQDKLACMVHPYYMGLPYQPFNMVNMDDVV